MYVFLKHSTLYLQLPVVVSSFMMTGSFQALTTDPIRYNDPRLTIGQDEIDSLLAAGRPSLSEQHYNRLILPFKPHEWGPIMGNTLQNIKFSIPWNLFLLTVGSVIYVVGINGIIVHHTFIPGGLYGFCLYIFYKTDLFSPGIWYFLLNIPLCTLGWLLVSRRFVLYTLYAVLIITMSSEFITIDLGIHEQIYAAVAAGFICGAGCGIILRSLGSAGGLDIISIVLHKYFNIGIGKTFLIFNLCLFSLVFSSHGADIFIASIILTFVTSNALDYFLSLFNQRKIIYVISECSGEIAQTIMKDLKIGATFIKGRGAYSGRDKEILMAITNNIQLKRVEEAVFTIDADALFIVENSYDVIGSSFRKRKIY